MKYLKEEVVRPMTDGIPTERYTVRITDCTKSKSQSGNEMIVTKLEIIAPEEIQTPQGRVMIAGRTHTLYTVLDPTVGWGIGTMLTGLEKAGFDFTKMSPDGAFDDSRLDTLLGFEFDIILSSQKEIARYALTPEEVKQGLKVGRPILDQNGQEIVKGYRVQGNWTDVAGPASKVHTSPSWTSGPVIPADE